MDRPLSGGYLGVDTYLGGSAIQAGEYQWFRMGSSLQKLAHAKCRDFFLL